MPFTGMPSFPSLTAEQASPYANLVSNMLSGYTNAVQAKYAPQQMQADIFSKQFAPLAQIASSPTSAYMLPDQQKQMADAISRILQSYTGQNNGGENGQPTNPITSVLNSGQSIQGGSPPSAPVSPQQQAHMDYVAGGGGANPKTNPYLAGNNNDSTNNPPTNSGSGSAPASSETPNYNYGLTFPSKANYTNDPLGNAVMQHASGAAGGLQNQAQVKLYNEQLEQQRTNYNTEQNNAAAKSKLSYQVDQDLDKFVGAYKKLTPEEKGVLGGNAKGISSNAQEADSYAASLVKDTAAMTTPGQVTDSNLALTKLMKVARQDNDQAVNNLATSIHSNMARNYEYQDYMYKMSQQRAPYPVSQSLWNKYMIQRPAYDADNRVANTAYANSWGDYTTPEAINNPSGFVPSNQQHLSSKNPKPVPTGNGEGQMRAISNQLGNSVVSNPIPSYTPGSPPPPGAAWMKSKKTNKVWAIDVNRLNDPAIKNNLVQVK